MVKVRVWDRKMKMERLLSTGFARDMFAMYPGRFEYRNLEVSK